MPIDSVHEWCVQEALNWAERRLTETLESMLAARILLAHVLNGSTTDLFVHPERTLSPPEQVQYRQLIAQRAAHKPVPYLLGHCAFMDLDLLIDRRALIPRPESEFLVEQAVTVARQWPRPRLIDVGTGSGAIAVSIAKRIPQAHVFATDRSQDALQLAAENARRHEVTDRITFLLGDLLQPLAVTVNVIVANLPYVTEAEYASLPPDIRLYEPREALVAGTDGLDTIRGLLDTASPHLTDSGAILIEIGATQGERAVAHARKVFPNAKITVLPDYAHRDRIVQIVLSPSCVPGENQTHGKNQRNP